jgi:alkylated DNA repair protein alkB family protein 1
MASKHNLDPHARPPEAVRQLYKICQKIKAEGLANDVEVLDLQRPDLKNDPNIKQVRKLQQTELSAIFQKFVPTTDSSSWLHVTSQECCIYEHLNMPGRTIHVHMLSFHLLD